MTASSSKTQTRQLMAAFALLILIVASVAITLNWRKPNKTNKDYGNLYKAGLAELHGEALYDRLKRTDNFSFIYPPSAAAMLAPLARFGPFPMVVALVLLTSIAWAFSAFAAVYLCTGKVRDQPAILYLIPVICTLAYVWDNFILGQPNLVLLACMLGMFVCLRKGRQWSAGALLAIAAAIKAFPIAAIVYLLWRRQWKAAASTLAVLALLLFVLPAPFRGFQDNADDLWKWTDGMLFHYGPAGAGQRPDRSFSWQNQSLLGVTQRLVRPIDANKSREKNAQPMFVNFIDISFRHANEIILSVVGALGLVYVLAMPRFNRRTPESDAIEWAILLILILIFSPYLFGYFNVWLLFPFTVLVQLYLLTPAARGRRALPAIFAICLLLLVFGLPIKIFYHAQALGNVLWAHLILFSVLTWHLWKRCLNSAPTTATPDRQTPADHCAA